MKSRRQYLKWTFALAILGLIASGCAVHRMSPDEKAMMEADWRFQDIVDVNFVKQYAKRPAPDNVMIIDARPYKPKYVNGRIPAAVSIPDSKFEENADKLPKDKNALLIYYCGGFACKMSHKSAKKAEKLGYSNVKVFAAGYPAWVNAPGTYAEVSLDYIEKELAENRMMLVDARPKRPKYDKGFIPSAVSLPDSKFEELKGKLPRDKNNLLVFYCGGFACKLSHKSAQKALDLGYTNVKVFAAGYPAWKKKYGAALAGGVPIKKGKEEGSIDIAAFKEIVEKDPDSILMIDVRDKDEYKKSHFKSSVNMPTDYLEKNIKSVPTDKPIVFVCSTGARSGEAYYMMQDLRPEVKEVYYLEAGVIFNKDGGFTIKKTE